jgi:hypothetical protein
MLLIPSELFTHPLSKNSDSMDAGFLNHKVILILTPQAWGKMMLAKHHYAMELAKRGNEVYFLNPPDNNHWSWRKSRERISIEALPEHPGLHIIQHELFFPYKLKFHSRLVYNFFVRKQIRGILKAIPKEVDIIWSFDLGNLFPLRFFNSKIFKIFHPVDEPFDKNAILAGSGAAILFSVTNEIIEKYKRFAVPSFFINHGLAEEFISKEDLPANPNYPINVGLSGNFLRPDLDRKILMQIISENPDLVFHFFGIYMVAHSNIGAATDADTNLFITRLAEYKNVKMHGVLNTRDLASALNQMDALLICYDMNLDQSKGTNYHKVMEYLSTGKVIISNNITTYLEYPELIRMSASRKDNSTLPALFLDTITHIEKWNSERLVSERKNFARNNTYRKQLDRIDVQIVDVIKMQK